ncbi:MAG TPA: thermonuclease family protein, partial [Halanaerobiales bacterium]|nr:thermonuclease family protein [Halanaerobiales bacterium]
MIKREPTGIKQLSVLLIFAFLFMFSASISAEQIDVFYSDTAPVLERVFVDYVYDGDTFRTAAGEKIRLLGIDTPEMNWNEGEPEFYAREALEYTLEKLLKENVYLEYDQEYRDKYGRVLAYVFLEDGSFFNRQLLEEGYAELMLIPPNLRYQEEFKAAVQEARTGKNGLWGRWRELEDSLPLISWQEAEEYYGQKVVIKGRIVHVHETERVFFLNYTEEWEDEFYLIIFKEDLIRFDYNPADLEGKELKVSGIIEEYRGRPQIIIKSPLQISCEEESGTGSKEGKQNKQNKSMIDTVNQSMMDIDHPRVIVNHTGQVYGHKFKISGELNHSGISLPEFYFSFALSDKQINAGRKYNKLGPGYFSQLLLSDRETALNMLSVKGDFMLEGYNIDYFQLFAFLDEGVNKWLFAHRLSSDQMIKNLEFGISETMMVSHKVHPACYLPLPYVPYYLTTYLIGQNTEYEIHDDKYIGMDFSYIFNNGARLYGELLVDEYPMVAGANNPDKRAHLFGFYYPLTTGNELRLEYSNVFNYVYLHRIEENHYSYNDNYLGHWL